MDNLFYKRCSVRQFKKDKVEDEKILELVKIGMSAPSACNKKPWEFYVIEDEKIKEEIKNAGRYTKYDSPLIIIVCANLDNTLPRFLKEYFIQDLSAATENILLGAVSLGLGACWCGVYLQDYLVDKIKKILSLPENILPFSMIHIGYPLKEGKIKTEFDMSKVHYIK